MTSFEINWKTVSQDVFFSQEDHGWVVEKEAIEERRQLGNQGERGCIFLF